ncbi:hypothetical protein BLNAU_11337 [Blattamonas nauphoetae]|uniref:Uncharacterized protein n=1 Tax=Blattamonas nauphoetae TaxID=2049346 RepID=A0ABQ9XQK9_9EUKA|nr:hypothetical protein BLNAU_11337 [Blattamonas nauphoetae]
MPAKVSRQRSLSSLSSTSSDFSTSPDETKQPAQFTSRFESSSSSSDSNEFKTHRKSSSRSQTQRTLLKSRQTHPKRKTSFSRSNTGHTVPFGLMSKEWRETLSYLPPSIRIPPHVEFDKTSEMFTKSIPLHPSVPSLLPFPLSTIRREYHKIQQLLEDAYSIFKLSPLKPRISPTDQILVSNDIKQRRASRRSDQSRAEGEKEVMARKEVVAALDSCAQTEFRTYGEGARKSKMQQMLRECGKERRHTARKVIRNQRREKRKARAAAKLQQQLDESDSEQSPDEGSNSSGSDEESSELEQEEKAEEEEAWLPILDEYSGDDEDEMRERLLAALKAKSSLDFYLHQQSEWAGMAEEEKRKRRRRHKARFDERAYVLGPAQPPPKATKHVDFDSSADASNGILSSTESSSPDHSDHSLRSEASSPETSEEKEEESSTSPAPAPKRRPRKPVSESESSSEQKKAISNVWGKKAVRSAKVVESESEAENPQDPSSESEPRRLPKLLVRRPRS